MLLPWSWMRKNGRSLLKTLRFLFPGTDRTNVCWIKEGCKTLAPKSCSRLPFDVVEYVERFDSYTLNLHLNRGCLVRDKPLDSQLNNAPASCNPPCFRITKPGEYCYMGTRNNNFSNRRHIGQITVIKPAKWYNLHAMAKFRIITQWCRFFNIENFVAKNKTRK